MDTSDESVQIIAEKKASKLGDDGMTAVAQNQASAAAMAQRDSFDERSDSIQDSFRVCLD